MAAKQEFESRFAKHKDELEWLFMELYHNREGLEVLEREMAEAYNARSAELKALDKARSADPEWYKRGNMFGMTMYTDLFAGNLKELAKKLPYLKEQKLTYLHLMPLLQMPHPHNDGGYAVEDFDTVDPALGTNKDLENLTRELRKAGISLCLDFVMNHTASTHRWAMAAKAGDPWFQAYYHLYDDRTIPDQYEQTVPQVFPNTAPGNFTWCEEMHKWVLTTFHDYQWDLNYANPAVFVDMTKSILHLANLGVEGSALMPCPTSGSSWAPPAAICRRCTPSFGCSAWCWNVSARRSSSRARWSWLPRSLPPTSARPKSRNATCSTMCPPWSTCGVPLPAGTPGC